MCWLCWLLQRVQGPRASLTTSTATLAPTAMRRHLRPHQRLPTRRSGAPIKLSSSGLSICNESACNATCNSQAPIFAGVRADCRAWPGSLRLLWKRCLGLQGLNRVNGDACKHTRRIPSPGCERSFTVFGVPVPHRLHDKAEHSEHGNVCVSAHRHRHLHAEQRPTSCCLCCPIHGVRQIQMSGGSTCCEGRTYIACKVELFGQGRRSGPQTPAGVDRRSASGRSAVQACAALRPIAAAAASCGASPPCSEAAPCCLALGRRLCG